MPRVRGDRIESLLARLRAQGVQEASFHPDGRLASVSFAGSMPPVDEKADPKPGKHVPPHISAARRALSVIHGTAEELEEA